jgi:hypothetical protein
MEVKVIAITPDDKTSGVNAVMLTLQITVPALDGSQFPSVYYRVVPLVIPPTYGAGDGSGK